MSGLQIAACIVAAVVLFACLIFGVVWKLFRGVPDEKKGKEQ